MRLNCKWLVILFVLTVLPLSGCGFVQKLKARNNLNKGVKAFADQKYEAAAQYFEKSLQLDPNFESARMYLATSFTYQFVPGSNKPENIALANKAIKIFEEVVAKAKDPSQPNADAMLSLATLYYQMNEYDKSKEWCGKVQKVYPQNAEAYYRIAVMDYKEASDKTGPKGENVADLKPDDKARIQKNIDEGIKDLEKALEIRPDYCDAMSYANLLWREKAKFEKDPKAKAQINREADKLFQRELICKKKVQEQEAQKPKKMVVK
jgi:tetratricopeptide (TPR) repeat protein